MLLKLISWNVNGLRAVMRKGLPEILLQLDGDIVCLQETKIQEDQLTQDMLQPQGYPFAYYHFAERKGYSG
ncbi:MAG: Exodeoxyribonuclease III, partial [Marinimicrobia bacterium 46_47]